MRPRASTWSPRACSTQKWKFGQPRHRAVPLDPGLEPPAEDEVLLGPTGGCALLRRRLLEDLRAMHGAWFDEQFFCYAEDTDLVIRARWLGYRAAYAADAIVQHEGSLSSGGPDNDFVLYHGIRNSLSGSSRMHRRDGCCARCRGSSRCTPRSGCATCVAAAMCAVAAVPRVEGRAGNAAQARGDPRGAPRPGARVP
jgi:GT2 family glycosyltransferase